MQGKEGMQQRECPLDIAQVGNQLQVPPKKALCPLVCVLVLVLLE